MKSIKINVVLVSPLYPINVGAVARLCKIFQVEHLILIEPKCDYLGEEARKAATHGVDYLEKAIVLDSFNGVKDYCDILAAFSSRDATGRNLIRTPWDLNEFAEKLSGIEGKIGLVFGRESDGLSNEEIMACDFMVTIPINSKYNVLNLSHAVSIALYQIHRATNIEIPFKYRIANEKEKERLLLMWNEMVDALDIQERMKRAIKLSFRNIVGRSLISAREAHSLIGGFKHIKNHYKKQLHLEEESIWKSHDLKKS